MPNYDAEIERESIFRAVRDDIHRIKYGLVECKKECQALKEQLEAMENKLKNITEKVKERYDV